MNGQQVIGCPFRHTQLLLDPAGEAALAAVLEKESVRLGQPLGDPLALGQAPNVTTLP
jgi:hypothetical protein